MRRRGATLGYWCLVCWACYGIDDRNVQVVQSEQPEQPGSSASNAGSGPGRAPGTNENGASGGSNAGAGGSASALGGGSAGTVEESPVSSRPIARLAFLRMPTEGVVGSPLPRIDVALQDAEGVAIDDATGSVTLSLAINPGGAGLVGFATSRAVAGVARFDALGISAPGQGYTLTASLAGLSTSATSGPVNVSRSAFANLASSLSGTPVYSLATGDGALVYASTEQGIFRSGDGGATWLSANFGSTAGPPGLVADAQNASVVYATSFTDPAISRASFRFLGKTTNGGDTWRSLSPPDQYTGRAVHVAVDPADPARVFACTGTGVFRSVDAGETWTPTAELGGSCQSIVFDDRSPAGLYAFSAALAVRFVLKSTDGGDSWQEVLPPLPELLTGLFSTPAGIFATSSTSLWRSTDGGATWSTAIVPSSALAGAPSDATRVYLADGGAVRVSTDGGLSFGSGVNLGFGRIFSLAVDRANAQRVYAGTETGAFVSSDGGATWRATSVGLGYEERFSVAVSWAQAGRVLLGGQDGILLSEDNGVSWTAAQGFTSSASQLVFDSFDGAYAYACAGNSQFFFSTDGGESWQVSRSISGPRCNDIVAHGTAVFVSGSGVTRSRDRGLTLEPTPLVDSTNALAVDQNAFDLYAGTAGGIFRSTDGGDTWTVVNPDPLSSALLIDPRLPTRVFSGNACTGLGNGGINRSTDSGQTWTPLSPTGCMEDLESANGTIYLLGEAGVLLSTDSGDTWRNVGPGLAGELRDLSVTRDGQSVFVATSEGLYRANVSAL